MTLTTDEADEILYGDRCIAKQDVSEHRWYTKRLIVYRHGDELRGFYYLDPSSELQEDQDRYESDPVETFPLKWHEQTITVYEKLDG